MKHVKTEAPPRKSILPFVIVCLAVACVLAPTPSTAGVLGTVTLKDAGIDPAQVMTLTSSGYNGGAYIGMSKIDIQSSGYGGVHVGRVDSFCIDLWDANPTSYQPYQVLPLDEAPDPGAGAMGTTRASWLASLLNNEWKAGLTGMEKSALQAAVWEVVDEGRVRNNDRITSTNVVPALSDLDVSNGTFRVSSYGGNNVSDIITTANQMLDRIATGVSFTGYLALSNDTVPGVLGKWQDYVVQVHAPLPGSILLGAFALGWAGRKLRKFV